MLLTSEPSLQPGFFFLIFKLKFEPTPFQYPSMVGVESVAGSPGRVELLKGKRQNKGTSSLVILGLGKEGIR